LDQKRFYSVYTSTHTSSKFQTQHLSQIHEDTHELQTYANKHLRFSRRASTLAPHFMTFPVRVIIGIPIFAITGGVLVRSEIFAALKRRVLNGFVVAGDPRNRRIRGNDGRRPVLRKHRSMRWRRWGRRGNVALEFDRRLISMRVTASAHRELAWAQKVGCQNIENEIWRDKIEVQ
jgi:hypothetical protein